MVDLLGRNPIRRRSEQMRLGAAAAQEGTGMDICTWKPWSQQISIYLDIPP
jgi:hypothetical protein